MCRQITGGAKIFHSHVTCSCKHYSYSCYFLQKHQEKSLCIQQSFFVLVGVIFYVRVLLFWKCRRRDLCQMWATTVHCHSCYFMLHLFAEAPDLVWTRHESCRHKFKLERHAEIQAVTVFFLCLKKKQTQEWRSLIQHPASMKLTKVVLFFE